MHLQVSLSELQDTAARMEGRFRERSDDQSVQLMAAYGVVVQRCASDLRNDRDELLSRGGALMLIQEPIGQRR